MNPIYIGTILLEKNRWAGPQKIPSYRVSDWIDKFEEAGFDGMELWQHHAQKCAPAELAKLAASETPIPIFNAYAAMTKEGRAERRECDALAAQLGASAVKFNLGGDPAQWDEHVETVREWRAELPDNIRLLCECHPETVIEEPEAAARFFEELGTDGWDIIVHSFSRLDSLQGFFDAFGPRVTHAHLQMRTGTDPFQSFREREDLAKEAIDLMKRNDFAGSYTLEFALGTGTAEENTDSLYAAALDDLAYLRELLG